MRKGLRWSIAGVIGLIAVASLLVIPAFGDGPVYGDVGVLRLHLNADGDRLVYDPTTGADLTQTLSQSNCKLSSSGDSLLSIVGSGSLTIKKPFAGLKDHRIGVGQNYEGTGEPCARINKDLGQVLTLSLTGALAGQSIGYAEIDLGFKYNGSAVLQLKKGGTLVDTVTVLCNGLSDCGPDSKASDNERVILYLAGTTPPPAGTWQAFPVAGVFDTIVIKPGTASPCSTCKTTYGGSSHSKDSAVSLEGGFSGALPGPLGVTLGTNDTLFKLVAPFDGELDCTETASLGERRCLHRDHPGQRHRRRLQGTGERAPVQLRFRSGRLASLRRHGHRSGRGGRSRPVPRSDHLELRRCA